MRVYIVALIVMLMALGCKEQKNPTVSINTPQQDSLELAQMIAERETAMVEKDITLAMDGFTDNATWINSQGYYFEGKQELQKFHEMMMHNDSLDYYYELGTPKIRIMDSKNAIAYYSWKMFWYKKRIPTDTTFREIGLMTLHAQKQQDSWKWSAVTNQHTPWFYDEITPVKIE